MQTDEEAERLVNENVALVKYLAVKLGGKLRGALDADDLIQVGLWALWDAARKFDESRGAKFTTYGGKCARFAMIRHLLSEGDTIRIPDYVNGEERDELTRRLRPERLSSRPPKWADVADHKDAERRKAEEDAEYVAYLLESLPPHRREVVERVVMGGEFHAAIAKERGVSRSGVQALKADTITHLAKTERGR